MLTLLIFLNIIHLIISAGIHKASSYINNVLVISEDKTIFNKARQFNPSVAKLKVFFTDTHNNIIHYWCPILIATMVLLATDLILLIKGHPEPYLNYAVSIMFGFGVVYSIHLIKLYNWFQFFSFCMLVAFYINKAEDINVRWRALLLLPQTEENDEIARQLLIDHQHVLHMLTTYFHATTNEKIKQSIEDCFKSLVDSID